MDILGIFVLPLILGAVTFLLWGASQVFDLFESESLRNKTQNKKKDAEKEKSTMERPAPSTETTDIAQFTKRHKILIPVIFWGFWILLVWWLMARNGYTPDLYQNAPIDPATEIMECTGLSGDPVPC